MGKFVSAFGAVGVAASFILASQNASAAGLVSASCGALGHTYTRTEQSLTPATLSSTAFEDVRNARIAFKVPGTTASCVIVQYSVQMQVPMPDQIFLRVQLDGRVIAEPGPVAFDVQLDSGTYGAHAFTWVFARVAPGSHSIKIQGRSLMGSPLSLMSQTIIVQTR